MKLPDPIYYVPVAAIQAGPGKISIASQDNAGFWTGSIISGDRTVEVTAYEKGPLAGLVKAKPTDIGWYFTPPLGLVNRGC